MSEFRKPKELHFDLESYLGLASQAEDADEIREQVLSLKRRLTQFH